MIQDEGIVSTGAGTHSPHPLQVTAKSQKRAGSPTNMRQSIGEQKANCPAAARSISCADLTIRQAKAPEYLQGLSQNL